MAVLVGQQEWTEETKLGVMGNYDKTETHWGLGFRDLEIFNLALLRQAWRLLTGDTSLSARILKAAYFPSCSLFDVELGSRPSQIWRSILDGRDILPQGVIRRTGDGKTTEIWSQNWIPRDSFKRPITSLLPNPPMMVAHLIVASSASWKEDLVWVTFTHFDAEEILRIPLCTRIVDDFWAWHEESRGGFSVRLPYRMILRTKLNREAWLNEEEGPSSDQQEQNKWSRIWHIKVPSKLRMFVWRLARQSMPTGDLLKHRNMSTEDTCLIYGAMDTWRHTLLTCPMLSSVWALAPEELVQHLVERQ